MKYLHFILFCLLIIAYETKIYDKCELHSTLKNLGLDGFRGLHLGHWICLALYASEFDTAHFETKEEVPYYGIFQINGYIWCNDGRQCTQNKCNIQCSKFLDDNIVDDVECAKKVILDTKEEMLSWPAYREYCIHPMSAIVDVECH